MACNCHGKNGVSVGRTSAFDQCTTCARKHVKAAWSKWQEFTYEDDLGAHLTHFYLLLRPAAGEEDTWRNT